MNKTGEDLLLADPDDARFTVFAPGLPLDLKEATGDDWRKEPLLSPVLFSLGSHGRRQEAVLALRPGSCWSERFSVNVPGTSGECSLSAPLRRFSVSVGYAPGVFAATQVVTVTPLLLLRNNTRGPLQLAEPGGLQSLQLAPGASGVFHAAALRVRVRRLAPRSEWSPTVAVERGGKTVTLVRERSEGYVVGEMAGCVMEGKMVGKELKGKMVKNKLNEDAMAGKDTHHDILAGKDTHHDTPTETEWVIQIEVMQREGAFQTIFRELEGNALPVRMRNDCTGIVITVCFPAGEGYLERKLPPFSSCRVAPFSPAFFVCAREVGVFPDVETWKPVYRGSLEMAGESMFAAGKEHVRVRVATWRGTQLIVFDDAPEKAGNWKRQRYEKRRELAGRCTQLAELCSDTERMVGKVAKLAGTKSEEFVFCAFHRVIPAEVSAGVSRCYRMELLAGNEVIRAGPIWGVFGAFSSCVTVLAGTRIAVKCWWEEEGALPRECEGSLLAGHELLAGIEENECVEICVPCFTAGEKSCEIRGYCCRTRLEEISAGVFSLWQLHSCLAEVEMAIQKTDSFLENPKSREFPSSSETCPYFDSDSNSDKNVHYLVSLHSMEQVANSRPFQSMYVVVQMGGYKVRSPSTARKSPEYVYPREPIRIALPPSEVDCEWSETPAGIVVKRLSHNSALFLAGVRTGFSLVSVNGELVSTKDSTNTTMKNSPVSPIPHEDSPLPNQNSPVSPVTPISPTSADVPISLVFSPPTDSFVIWSFDQEFAFPAEVALYQHSLQVSIFEETEKEDILRCQEIVSLPREGDEVSELTEIGSIRLAGGWEQSQIPAVLSLSVKIRCEGVGVSVMDQWREEWVNLSVGEIQGIFAITEGRFITGAAGIRSLQLDSQRVTRFPVILASEETAEWLTISFRILPTPAMMVVEQFAALFAVGNGGSFNGRIRRCFWSRRFSREFRSLWRRFPRSRQMTRWRRSRKTRGFSSTFSSLFFTDPSCVRFPPFFRLPSNWTVSTFPPFWWPLRATFPRLPNSRHFSRLLPRFFARRWDCWDPSTPFPSTSPRFPSRFPSFLRTTFFPAFPAII